MSKYILPIATKNTLGGVKIGDYITVKEDGTISVDIDGVEVQIEDAIESIKAGKKLIAEAITERGIATADTDTFQVMANNILKITTESNNLYNMYLVDP